MIRLLGALFVGLLLSVPALAGEREEAFSRGVAAYNAGDYATAIAEFRTAAAGGMGDAQFNLGLMYSNGQGVVQDYEETLKWWRQAAAQDVADAQNNLGMMYENGRGVEQNYEEAVSWYRAAAEQGKPYAQHNLGAMYANGRGVERNLVLAHMWFNLATAGHPSGAARNQSASARDQVAQRMSSVEITQAQRLAKNWTSQGQVSAMSARAAGAPTQESAAIDEATRSAKPSRAAVRSAQQALHELGYDPGPVDGIEGPRTRAALSAYQKANGTAETGHLTAAVIGRLVDDARTHDATAIAE
jgi:TPR repeat protein